mmetsp:Transcript_180640/g.573229  ORF Transcript_180640/g.573229 Transcript_180640/m.573229 type:complete len:190 (-) Transcript_180640:32-601(-)
MKTRETPRRLALPCLPSLMLVLLSTIALPSRCALVVRTRDVGDQHSDPLASVAVSLGLAEEAPVILGGLAALRQNARIEIAHANQLDDESAHEYEEHLEQEASLSKDWRQNVTLNEQARQWKTERDAVHESYHQNLARAHADLHDFDVAEKAAKAAAAGKPLGVKQLKAMMAVLPKMQAAAASASQQSS